MRRASRLRGQLPSPPKSSDGSQLSETSNDFATPNQPARNETLTPPHDGISRVLRRQSIQSVAGEIHAFFNVAPLPTGKDKRDFLVHAVDRISSLCEEPSRGRSSGQRTEKGGSPDTAHEDSTTTNSPSKKLWLTAGLYAGTHISVDDSKILYGRGKASQRPKDARKFKFSLPLFHGKLLMDKKQDFKLPWNLYATSGQRSKPPNWSRIRRSILAIHYLAYN
jgi:hypothetical protein